VTAEPWAVEFERRADKDLERLDPQVKQRVLSAIGRLADDPRTAEVRKLKGRAESRLRVGDQSTGSPAWRRSCSVARYLVFRVRPSCATRPASRSRLRS
jgi:hypothetical protein